MPLSINVPRDGVNESGLILRFSSARSCRATLPDAIGAGHSIIDRGVRVVVGDFRAVT